MTNTARKLIQQVEQSLDAESGAKNFRERAELEQKTNTLMRTAWHIVANEIQRDAKRA